MSRRFLNSCALRSVLAAGALALAAPLHAFDFSEGSFEEGSFGDQPKAPAPAPESGDAAPAGGFDEGSFADDGTPNPSPDPGSEAASEDAAQQDDGFASGSFGDQDTDPVEERAPDPPEPQPEPDRAEASGIEIDPQILAFETRDFGVPPQDHMRRGQFHGPTPAELPGGYTVSTQGIVDAYYNGIEMIVIDVLGSDYGLPDAYVVPDLSTPGDFNDRIQQQAAIWLNNVTGGDITYPIVVYCSGPECWLSYNGALRAVAAGYTNVYWYRGGLQAWKMAGLTVYPTGF